MRGLREGVKLKKVQERQYNPLPIEYQLTPYEMLMDDIRSKRYKLRKVMVSVHLRPNRHIRYMHASYNNGILEWISAYLSYILHDDSKSFDHCCSFISELGNKLYHTLQILADEFAALFLFMHSSTEHLSPADSVNFCSLVSGQRRHPTQVKEECSWSHPGLHQV